MSKREDYISWDAAFMGVAAVMSKRCKDPDTQNGVAIVNARKRIVAVGYNGMPDGCSDDEFPWDRTGENPWDTKYPYVQHAERNAIGNCDFRGLLEGATMYLYSERGYIPCTECAKEIVNARIAEIVMPSILVDETVSRRYNYPASLRLFKTKGIRMRVLGMGYVGYDLKPVGEASGLTADLMLEDLSNKLMLCAKQQKDLLVPCRNTAQSTT